MSKIKANSEIHVKRQDGSSETIVVKAEIKENIIIIRFPESLKLQDGDEASSLLHIFEDDE